MIGMQKDIRLGIRSFRERRALTEDELGGIAHMHRGYIRQIERGEKNIGLKNLEKIAKALGVKAKDLL